MPTLQHGELSVEREIFEVEAGTRPQEANKHSEKQDNESMHDREL